MINANVDLVPFMRSPIRRFCTNYLTLNGKRFPTHPIGISISRFEFVVILIGNLVRH